jgi:hypothetical protein
MNKTIMIIFSFLIISSTIFGQTTKASIEKIKNHIIALDKSGWEAWKNKDAKWFKTNTTEDFLSINSEGISNKEQVIQSTLNDCDVKNISLNNFNFVMLNESTVLLTYTAIQDGECGGVKLTQNIRVAVNYIKRGEKWFEALYMETPIIKFK